MSSLKSVLRAQATPLTIGLFLISTVSGVALFFHLGTAWFREMHEILSLVLLVPVVLHLWRNWLPLKIYARHAALYVGLLLSVAMAAPFVIETATGSGAAGNPMMAMVQALEKAPLSAMAPAIGLDATAAETALEAGGIADVAADETVAGLAARSGRSTAAVFALLNAARTAPPAPAAP